MPLHLVEAGSERRVPSHDEWRHRLGDSVADEIGLAEHARRVADGRPRLDGRERHDLGDVIGSIAIGGVADHLAPAALVEVHVDVGHLLAAGVQEPLEEQVVFDGVEVHDPQAVGHAAAGGRTPPRTDSDPVRAGVGDEVPDDEEVRRETHLGDHPQLELHTLDDLRREHLAIAVVGPLVGEVA